MNQHWEADMANMPQDYATVEGIAGVSVNDGFATLYTLHTVDFSGGRWAARIVVVKGTEAEGLVRAIRSQLNRRDSAIDTGSSFKEAPRLPHLHVTWDENRDLHYVEVTTDPYGHRVLLSRFAWEAKA